jgi:hypothetical protein
MIWELLAERRKSMADVDRLADTEAAVQASEKMLV